jgi:hypothetical protein
MIGSDGLIWNHEQVNVIPAGEAFATTGPLELADGNMNMAIRQVFPDTQKFGDIEIEFFAKQHSTDAEVQFGPFQYRNPTPTTGVQGREVRMKVRGLVGGWEFGTPRLNVDTQFGGFR